MPLKLIQHIHAEAHWGIWHIQENTETLLQLLDSPEQHLDFLDPIQHPDKKNESIAARLVVKKLMESQGQAYPGIHKDECSKPLLYNSRYHVSLSHAIRYAIGMIHPSGAVGIDMETPREQLRRIAKKYLSSQERKYYPNDLDTLTILWVIKEALYKLYGKRQLSLRYHMGVEALSGKPEGIARAWMEPPGQPRVYYQVYYRAWEEYYIAYTSAAEIIPKS